MLVNTYNPSEKVALKVEYKSSIREMAEELLIGNKVRKTMENSLRVTRQDSLKLRTALDFDIPNTDVSEKDYALAIKDYGEEERKELWKYRRMAVRIALVGSILDDNLNKKKFSFRLQKTMESILDVILSVGKDHVTLSQIVHSTSSVLGVNKIKTRQGEEIDADAWVNDEIALQFCSELAEQHYIDIRVESKTHIVCVSQRIESMLDKEEVARLSGISRFLAMQTILTSVPEVEPQRTSISSWWYKTPGLSASQIEFVQYMNKVRYGFTDNAEDVIEERYLTHLQEPKLPNWAQARVEQFKLQIAASKANGGHHVSNKDDSATRTYMGGEIGMFQTSKPLRSIVTLKDIKDPVKWDFRNNVVQMYSVLTGVRDLGKYVGLTDNSDQLGDLRAILAETMNKELGITTFNKDNTKPLFMIWAYNAGKKRLMNGVVKERTSFFTGTVYEKLVTPGLIEIAGIEDTEQVWDVWTTTLGKLVPSIIALKRLFNLLTKANPVTECSWVMPDGAIAQYASAEAVSKELHWVSSTYTVHTHTHYRKEIVPGAKNTGLLPRIIHSFDAYVMRQLVVRCNRLGITIVPNHDSFIFDREYEATVFDLVKDILIELRHSNHLEKVVNSLNVKGADLTVRDDNNIPVSMDMFGAQLTDEDIRSGEPMDVEDM